MNKNLRIACYGYVKKGGGSITGAHFLILEELLKRGIEIDFYGKKNFSYPQELCKYKNFNLSDAKQPPIKNLLKPLPKSLFKKMMLVIVNNVLSVRQSNFKMLQQQILANHKINQYDLYFFLGQYSQFNFPDIPTISWVQGPPAKVQWESIQKVKKKVIELCGIFLYLQIKFAYALKTKSASSAMKNSDVLICGSQWSKGKIVENGIESQRIRILPYPIDINFFQLGEELPSQQQQNEKVFLWLGRSEPRKRLDLLVEAYDLLLQERRDVRLKIFGGFSWATGYRKLIDNFKYPEQLEYQTYIDKSEVPALMRQCDVLIQPSEGENFGSSVAEALACGLPVIVGSTNGTKDFTGDSSFIFEEYTPESLKNEMIRAIEAVEERREQLALDARATAEQNFDVAKVVDDLENIFQESLKSDRAKPKKL